MVVDQIHVTTPDGESGLWAIQSFEVTKEEAERFNMRQFFQGKFRHTIDEGKYKRLIHKERGVIMSNTPMEVWTNMAFIRAAKDDILINGLGLGMLLHALLPKPEVTSITVVEIEQDVVNLTAPHFQEHINSGRLKIVVADCFKHIPPKGQKYGAVWHDIWDNFSDDNLFQMTKLKLKYCKRTKWQGCWGEDECKAMRREIDRVCRASGKTYAGFVKFTKENRL